LAAIAKGAYYVKATINSHAGAVDTILIGWAAYKLTSINRIFNYTCAIHTCLKNRTSNVSTWVNWINRHTSAINTVREIRTKDCSAARIIIRDTVTIDTLCSGSTSDEVADVCRIVVNTASIHTYVTSLASYECTWVGLCNTLSILTNITLTTGVSSTRLERFYSNTLTIDTLVVGLAANI
jgi:hypothetical protein